MLILKNCKFISQLTEGGIAEGSILVEGNRILSIRKGGEPLDTKAEDQVLDMEGKYVLPGLFDLHVHLTLSGGDTLIDNTRTVAEHSFLAQKFARETLEAGFTTIRDVGSYFNVAVELRNAVNAGWVVGPNIIACGKIVTTTENGNDFYKDLYTEADGEHEIWKAIREEVKNGADFIKIMGTGAIMNPGGDPGQPIFTLEEFKSAVEAAQFKDTYVAAHCHGNRAIKNAIIAGIHTIEHCSIMEDDTIEMLAASQRSFAVPTLAITKGLCDNLPDSSVWMQEKARNVLNLQQKSIRKLYLTGARIGFATDMGGLPMIHGENAQEFVARKEYCGMKELDILRQATIDSAFIAGIDKDYGTIEAGKVADIIAVTSNPLEDISIMQSGVCTVIKSGAIIKNS